MSEETIATIKESTLLAIARAIREKTGADAKMLPSEMSGEIAKIKSASDVPPAESDINFYRPDGVLLASYTAEEVADDGWSMPLQPEWTVEWDTAVGRKSIPMTRQGWNYSREMVVRMANDYGRCDVCGMYVPADGASYFRVNIETLASPTVRFAFGQSVSEGVVVDWGDGSAPERFSGTSSATSAVTRTHDYPSAGRYVISANATSGVLFIPSTTSSSGAAIYGNRSNGANSPGQTYSSKFTDVIIGSGVGEIGANSFSECHNLRTVVIPGGVTAIRASAFYGDNSMTFCGVPSGTGTIEYSVFTSCYGLQHVSLPQGLETVGYSLFAGCNSLVSSVLPSGIGNVGNGLFSNCTALKSVVLPDGVSVGGMGNMLYGCSSIKRVSVPSGSEVNRTGIGANFCYNCYSLEEAEIAEGVSIINGSVFANCRSLRRISLPSTVSTIRGSFGGCFALTEVVMPSAISVIEASAFSNCYGVELYDFSDAAQIPSLGNANAFSGISNTCKIVVPDGLYDDWISANVWNSSSIVTHIVRASEYFN